MFKVITYEQAGEAILTNTRHNIWAYDIIERVLRSVYSNEMIKDIYGAYHLLGT